MFYILFDLSLMGPFVPELIIKIKFILVNGKGRDVGGAMMKSI